MPDLSVLIPARNEEYLSNTVADVLAASRADTEVIVVLDGAWPKEPLQQHEKLQVVYVPEPIGQRAATNLAARLSKAEFVMKLDAHCRVAEGFDVALIAAARTLGRNVTQVPLQKNLHVYDQLCERCGYRTDQAPDLAACTSCGNQDLKHALVWEPRQSPNTTNWIFDHDLHFQYASNKRQTGDYPETMSMIGACLFVDREHYFELGGFDEAVGSWGQFGQEWSCKEWLSGGRVVCNRLTWFAHFFRVGGIGFPYDIHGNDQERARRYSRDYWRNNRHERQVHSLRWLVDRFWPVLQTTKVAGDRPAWTEAQRDELGSLPRAGADSQPADLPAIEAAAPDAGTPTGTVDATGVAGDAGVVFGELPGRDAGVVDTRRGATRGICYYSDCRPDARILEASRKTIEASGMPIVAVTLEPIRWPSARNAVLPMERGHMAMFRQILIGLELLDTDYVFLAEHDVLYHESHWRFTPPADDLYYYNLNWVKVDQATGRAVSYVSKQTSQLCANRRLLVEHYRRRIDRVEREGFSRKMGFEPGSHGRSERVDDVRSDTWRSEFPNIDVRHSANLTSSRWSQKDFRDQRNCREWREMDAVWDWGQTLGRFDALLSDVLGERELVEVA